MTRTKLTAPVNTYIFLLLTFLISPAALAAKAPVFELPGDSGTISLKEYRNQVVFVDFWASWCVPCKYSFPWMNEMQERYGKDGLKVIGINVDKDKAMAKKFLEHVPATFDIAYDPEGEIADLYSLKVMPSSYLIDRDGNLVHAHKGFKTSDGSQMEDMIRKLIDDKK
jgi:thiol-disulfide isomerase/thioredoxin